MKAFISSILSLAFLSTVLFSGGCAQNQQALARLEQENAQQRERIWQSNRKMEDFRRENEALRQQIETLKSRNTSTTTPTTASSGNWTATRQQSIPLSVVPTTNSDTNSPASSGVTPQPPTTTFGSQSSPETLPINPPTGAQATVNGAKQPVRVRKTDSQNVQSVQILPERTKAIHYEGLHAEFQMKDAAGNIVLAAAPIVVMVTDPTKTGEAARVSKWNYTAEDVADIINSGQAGISVPLNMAWAKSCPENLNLELHILYCTSDKRMLTHRAKINLSSSSIAQGGLTLESANPAVGAQVQPIQRPQWGPNP